jgi:hypothetical protein
MARNRSDQSTGRLFRNASAQDHLFEKSYEEELESRSGQRVECLGLTFENDAARRAHFHGRLKEGLEKLHAKLSGVPFSGVDDAIARMKAVEAWPMGDETQLRTLAEHMRHAGSSKDLLERWKDGVGFPRGEIEDILKLSDPPYYTACPNPFLSEFVKTHGKPYDPDKLYNRKPFAVDVSEGKTHPVYRAHAYHTKVPHLAIVPSILHYTDPGDLIFDGFAGSGMTGVAAQWCGTAPQSYRTSLEAIWTKEERGKPQRGVRYTIQNDLSPLASFIAANYNLPFDVDAFAKAARKLLDDVENELGWMYQTLHSDGKTKGRIEYTIWSEVFTCPDCTGEVVFTDEALDQNSGRVREIFPCPHCGSELTKHRMERLYESHFDPSINSTIRVPKREPSVIVYSLGGKTYEKGPNASDLEILSRIGQMPLPSEVPSDLIPPMHMTHERARMDYSGVTHVHHFFLPRARQALASLWRRAAGHPDPRIRHVLLFFVEQAIWGMSVLARYVPSHYSQVNQYLTGVYYIASHIVEVSPWYILEGKLSRLEQTFTNLPLERDSSYILTASTTASLGIPDRTIDYIFTDPPFGENIYYADLNFLVESWHKVLTNAVREAIVDRFKRKGLPEYQSLMQRQIYPQTFFRCRWIS